MKLLWYLFSEEKHSFLFVFKLFLLNLWLYSRDILSLFSLICDWPKLPDVFLIVTRRIILVSLTFLHFNDLISHFLVIHINKQKFISSLWPEVRTSEPVGSTWRQQWAEQLAHVTGPPHCGHVARRQLVGVLAEWSWVVGSSVLLGSGLLSIKLSHSETKVFFPVSQRTFRKTKLKPDRTWIDAEFRHFHLLNV